MPIQEVQVETADLDKKPMETFAKRFWCKIYRQGLGPNAKLNSLKQENVGYPPDLAFEFQLARSASELSVMLHPKPTDNVRNTNVFARGTECVTVGLHVSLLKCIVACHSSATTYSSEPAVALLFDNFQPFSFGV